MIERDLSFNGAATPTPASIAVAAESPLVDPSVLDSLITRWLFATGRLKPPPASLADVIDRPGWGAATAAYDLMTDLLPAWRLDRLSGATTAVLVSASSRVTATGPTFARAILAATFRALDELDAEVVEQDALAELRSAMEEEMAHG